MDRFGEKVLCNPTVKLTKGTKYPLIDIDKIIPGYKWVTNQELVEYSGQSGAKFEDGDILFARITPCLENGKMAIAKTDGQKGIGSTELFVFRGIDNMSVTDYVYYLLCMKHMRQLAANSMTGASGRQRADLTFIKRIKWQFPSVQAQNRIVSVLSVYDSLIENNNKRIKVLEQLAENLYKEWFVRFRFLGYENAEFENGIPKGWELKRIGDLVQLKSGYAFKSEWWIEEGVPVIKIKDIESNTINLSDLSFVSKVHAEKSKLFFVNPGDLLIALTGATIGKIGLVPYCKNILTVNQRVGKFFLGKTPCESVAFWFCMFQQTHIQEHIIAIASSNAAQPNISPFDIERIRIPYNKDVVDKFNKKVQPFVEQILDIRRINHNLVKQRDLLLPRLMSGKLEV